MVHTHQSLRNDYLAAKRSVRELHSASCDYTPDDANWTAFFSTIERLDRTFVGNPNYAATVKNQFSEHNLAMCLATIVLGGTAAIGVGGLVLAAPPLSMLASQVGGLIIGKHLHRSAQSYRTEALERYVQQRYLVDRLEEQWLNLRFDTQSNFIFYNDAREDLRRWAD